MDCIAHVVTKSWTQLGNFHFHFQGGGESKVHNSKLSLLLFVVSKSSFENPRYPYVCLCMQTKILKTTSETVKKVVI